MLRCCSPTTVAILLRLLLHFFNTFSRVPRPLVYRREEQRSLQMRDERWKEQFCFFALRSNRTAIKQKNNDDHIISSSGEYQSRKSLVRYR
jgi:hypothetical protein